MPLAYSPSRTASSSEVSIDARLSSELYAQSGATAYGLSQEQFKAILTAVVGWTEELSGAIRPRPRCRTKMAGRYKHD